VNAVPVGDFCGGQTPEVRVFTKREGRHRRKAEDIIEYARLCLGRQNCGTSTDGGYDFATRVVLK
jgi:hypothetical protein